MSRKIYGQQLTNTIQVGKSVNVVCGTFTDGGIFKAEIISVVLQTEEPQAVVQGPPYYRKYMIMQHPG